MFKEAVILDGKRHYKIIPSEVLPWPVNASKCPGLLGLTGMKNK